MDIAIDILLPSCLQAEICVLTVLEPPSWISDFRLHLTILTVALLERISVLENVDIAVGICLLYCLLAEI